MLEPSTATSVTSVMPDHQRGGRRCGAAGVADGVGAGEFARDAAGAARRPADEAGQRDRPGAARAAPCRGTARGRRRRAATTMPMRAQPAGEERRRPPRRPRPPTMPRPTLNVCAAKREGGSVAPSRTAAIGGTRVARRAGRMLATSVTTRADHDREDDRARRDDGRRRRAARRPWRRTARSGPSPARCRRADRAPRRAGRSRSPRRRPSA